MRGEPDREFRMRNSNGFGDGSSRSSSGKRSSMCRHLERAGSARQILLRVHWVRPELAAEVKFLTWSEDGSRVKSSTRASGKTSRARDFQRPVSLEPRAARAIFRVSNGLYRWWH